MLDTERTTTLPAGHVRLTLTGFSGDQFGEVSLRHGAPAREGHVRVAVGGYPASRDAVEPWHRACSFVIDCDEPDVAALSQRLQEQGHAAPGIERLVALVDQAIDHKTTRRGFDVASVVARRREGDCTEHAALLAAVARRFGYPSRVVVGIVLLDDASRQPRAFGHAWAEIHDGARWSLADAALRSHAAKSTSPLSYLPVAVMNDEGPGFAAGLLRQANVWHIWKVEVGEGGPPAKDARARDTGARDDTRAPGDPDVPSAR